MVDLWMTIRAGMLDSLNPGGFALMLVFTVFLIAMAKRRYSITWSGIIFIAAIFHSRVVFSGGGLDRIVYSKPFDVFLDVVYFIFVILSFLGGVFFWRKWCYWRKQDRVSPNSAEALRATTPSIKESLDGKKSVRGSRFLRRLSLVITIFPLGWLIGLMLMAWAPDGYVSIVISQLALPANLWEYITLVNLYAGAFVGILVFLLIVVQALAKSGTFMRWIEKSPAMVSIVASAVFLAYGVSFLSYYLDF